MTEFLRSRKGRITVIAAAIVLTAAIVLMILLMAGGETGYRSISVSKISGIVMAENNGNTYEAYENMRLADGYALTTGVESYTRLSLDDDKYMKLEQESRAEFRNVGDAKNHVTSIYLAHGALTAELVNPLAEEESFVVNTPNAVLAVRGTFFRIEVTFDEIGEAFTDVYTYGGAVACHRIMPDGTEVNEEVMVNQGYKARIKMDEIITVYVEELIEYEPGDDVDPINVDVISDSDIVDIYNASYHGHTMFLDTEELWQEILDREIDISEYYSVYDMGEVEEYTVTSESEEEQTEVSTAVSETTTVDTTATGDTTTTAAETTEAVITTAAETTAASGITAAFTVKTEETTTVSIEQTNTQTTAIVTTEEDMTAAETVSETYPTPTVSSSSSSTVTVPTVTSVITTTSLTEESTVTVPSITSQPEETTGTSASETVPEVTSEPEEPVDTSTSASETDRTTETVPEVTSDPEESTTSVPEAPPEPPEESTASSSSSEPEPAESSSVSTSEAEPVESSSSSSSEPEPAETSSGSSSEPEPVETSSGSSSEPEPAESSSSSSASEPEPAESSSSSSSSEPEPEPFVPDGVLYMEDGSVIITATGYKQGVYEELDDVEEIPYTGDYVISQRDGSVVLDHYIDVYANVPITLDGINITSVELLSDVTLSGTNKENYLTEIFSSRKNKPSLTLRDINLNMYASELYSDVEISVDVLTLESGVLNVVKETSASRTIDVSILNINGGTLYVNTGSSDYGITADEINVSGGILQIEESPYYSVKYSVINISGGRVYATENGIACSWWCGLPLENASINMSGGFLWASGTDFADFTITGGCIVAEGVYTGGLSNGTTKYTCTVYDTYPGNIPVTLADRTTYTYTLAPEDAAEDGKYYVWLPVQEVEPDGIAIDDVNFPDPVFREYVSDNFDIDEDGYLSEEEINNATSISISRNSELTALKGIEYFTELTDLRCDNTGITFLDVTKNTELTYLDCGNTKITLLDVNNNTALTYLSCYNTAITALDVSKNTALISLSCFGTQITDLDLSNNTALEFLRCYINTQLISLNVSKNTALIYLDCGATGITTLDISNNTMLMYLYCYSTGITSLDLGNNVTALMELSCYDCNLPYVDISGNNRIADFFADGNVYPIPSNITTFDTRTDPNFNGFDPSKVSDVKNAVFDSTTGVFSNISGGYITYTYDCGQGKSETFTLARTGEPIEGIAISEENFPDTYFRNWVSRNIDKNNDGYLSDEERNVSISLAFYTRSLTSLTGIEYLPKLSGLDCYNTGITALDVSKNTALRQLNCSGTGITALDVSNNTALRELNCSTCSLPYIDISNNPLITTFDASDNTYPIPSDATTFDTRTDPNFEGFKSENVSNVQNATFSDGVFTNITGDITYTYDCGQGYSETFTLARTASYSLTAPSDQPLSDLLPPDLTTPEGYAAPNIDGIADLSDDQNDSGDELDTSDPSEGLVTDEGQTAPDTDSTADFTEDPEGHPPDSGDVPVEEVLALARGQPP